MKPLRLITIWFCITCIFLCGAFSAKGQQAAAAERLLALERIVFESDDPAAVNAALAEKAACYEEAGRYGEALSTLERIRLYQLSGTDRQTILLAKARCCYALGDWAPALGHLEESGQAEDHPALYAVLLAHNGRYGESEQQALQGCSDAAAVRALFRKAPRERKESTAAWLSFLPPLGQLYLGEPGRGAGMFLLSAGSAAFTVWQCLDGCWVTGLLGGGLLLRETYFDRNLIRNIEAVEDVNAARRAVFAEKLEKALSL